MTNLEILSCVRMTNVITEKQIKDLQRNAAAGDINALDRIVTPPPRVTVTQDEKGVRYLVNLFYTPTGKVRKTNPFNPVEQLVLNVASESGSQSYFIGLRHTPYSRTEYVPIYQLKTRIGSIYYYLDGRTFHHTTNPSETF